MVLMVIDSFSEKLTMVFKWGTGTCFAHLALQTYM